MKITQEKYKKGQTNCKKNLHGHLVLNKGDKPITAREFINKIKPLWKTSGQ
jgi:hypothetical protein